MLDIGTTVASLGKSKNSRSYQLLRMIGVRRVTVVEEKNLVGILSNTDLFRAMVDEIG